MIKVEINNEEVVSSKEFVINEEMLTTSSTILNNCYPKTWEEDKDYVSRFYYPLDYSKCNIYKDDDLIFSGVVKNTGNISLKPQKAKYCSLQILDFKTLLSEGETLDFVISGKTITEAISQVIDAIQDYGVVLGEIKIKNPDDIIGSYSTLNKTAYDVFQYLADISQSRWTTRRLNEHIIAVDFYDPELMPRGVNIEYTQEWFQEHCIHDLSFSYNTNDYRNKQIILSDEVYADIDYEELIIANGFDKNFITSESIGKIKEIKLNGAEVSFATNSDKELGITADFYYTPGKNVIEYNEGSKTPVYGTRLNVKYTPIVQGRQIVFNTDEINRITDNINRKGVIERYESRNDVLSSDELRKIGQTYIKYKGTAEVILKIVTEENIWNVGEVTYFSSPISELTKDYMVKKKSTKIISTIDKIFYTYELTSSFNSESAINYFDNQRNKANGNISQGEFITRNIDINNVANIIFYGLEINEAE